MGPIVIEEIRVEDTSDSLTKYSGIKSETINQIAAINESFEKLNEKLFKLKTTVEGISDKVEQLNDDVMNLKKDKEGKFDDIKRTNDEKQTLLKNVLEPSEKVPDEDMTSLVLEVKRCIKSYRRMDKDNSAIKEKLYKVYGRNFFDH